MYFREACRGVGLCAEALKYIPAGHNVGECLVIQQIHVAKIFSPEVVFLYQGEGDIVNGIETTALQSPQMKKGKAS